MMTIYFYILMCAIWFVHIFRTRKVPSNNLETFLNWTLFIPVTITILIIGLVFVVVEWCKERS